MSEANISTAKIARRNPFDIHKPETFTEQRIFDYVVRMLAEQGQRSVGEAGECRYRGPNNLKCAVGCLLPDTVYARGMECLGVKQVIQDFGGVQHLRQYERLLWSLQSAHDTHRSPKDLRDGLKDTAKRFGLKPAMADTITEWK